MPLPLEEKIEVLVLLAIDKGKDEEISQKALQTLQAWNVQELHQALSSPSISIEALDSAATHLAPKSQELMEALLQNPKLPDSTRDRILTSVISAGISATDSAESSATEAPASASDNAQAQEGKEKGEGEGKKKETLIEKVNRMSAVEKIKAALTGNQEMRMLLIRDSNKIVSRAVLQSPKLSDSEMEAYASAKNVSEEVLRLVAMNRAFIKNYPVVRALVNNPRAPLDITLPLINRLNEKDQKNLTMNKNVPETLRTMTIKMIKQKEEAKKPKLPGKH